METFAILLTGFDAARFARFFINTDFVLLTPVGIITDAFCACTVFADFIFAAMRSTCSTVLNI